MPPSTRRCAACSARAAAGDRAVIEWLIPAGFAALAALAIPILIHLVRRSERRVVDFAALRWLVERNRPRRQVRLHERLLLAVRLLLIAALAAILAQPVWRRADSRQPQWVVVAPSVPAATARAEINMPGSAWHWLAPDFPALDETPAADTASTSSLIRELDDRLPPQAELTLVVPEILGRLDAERLRLRHRVNWKIAASPAATVLERPAPAVTTISARYDAAGKAELGVLEALTRAWNVAGKTVTLDVASSDLPIAANSGIVFWFAATETPALRQWIDAGGTAVVTRHADAQARVVLDDDRGAVLLTETAQRRGRRFAFPKALTVEALPALRHASLPERLRAVLIADAAAPDQARADAVAPAPSATPAPDPATSMNGWLALLVALLFVAERWLATGRRRVAE